MAEMLGTILACHRSGMSPRGISRYVWGSRYVGIDDEDGAGLGRCRTCISRRSDSEYGPPDATRLAPVHCYFYPEQTILYFGIIFCTYSLMSSNDRAEPIAKGILPTAVQSFEDLFIWKQRVEVISESGESHSEWQSPEPLKNPISLMAQLSARDWLFFLVGLAAWTADAFDFHALSIQTKKLSDYYDRSKTDVTTAITLTLLLRSVGAALFGLAGDRYGRKWPMVVNMIVLGVLQVATIYSQTFQQFLAVRSLFGLFMGGVYGNAIAMALEHCP